MKNTQNRVHLVILAALILGGVVLGYQTQRLLPLPDPVLPATPNIALEAPWYSLSCTTTDTGMVCIAVPYFPEFLDLEREDPADRG